jgi:drug/metabolite transporter (DMT)-like permease
LPLFIVTVLGNLVPLFIALLGSILLKEKINTVQKLCLLIAFGGVFVLISSNKYTQDDETKSISAMSMLIATSVPILTASG